MALAGRFCTGAGVAIAVRFAPFLDSQNGCSKINCTRCGVNDAMHLGYDLHEKCSTMLL